MVLRPILFLLLVISYVLGAFKNNDRVCWRRSCIIRTDAGTLCFEPHDNGVKHEECTDNFLKNLTHVHLTSTIGRSILYYDNKARVLGAATWAISSSPVMAGSVFVCMTGQHADDPKQYRTACRTTYGDDDMEVPAAHARECVSDQKPQHVGGGCFRFEKPGGGEDNHKEWYEHPVVAGFFWVLGVLVTLGSMYMWGGKAVRVVRARLPRRLMFDPAALVEQPARGWRQPVFPLLTYQPAIISDQAHVNGSVSPAMILAACVRCSCSLQRCSAFGDVHAVRICFTISLALNADYLFRTDRAATHTLGSGGE